MISVLTVFINDTLHSAGSCAQKFKRFLYSDQCTLHNNHFQINRANAQWSQSDSLTLTSSSRSHDGHRNLVTNKVVLVESNNIRTFVSQFFFQVNYRVQTIDYAVRS